MKKFILPVALTFLFLSCGQKKDAAEELVSQTNNSAAADFSGSWQIITTDKVADFTLNITQKTDSISGWHCAVAHGGAKMDCYNGTNSFSGLVTGNSATINFESSFGARGKATLTLNDKNQLLWKLGTVEGEYFLPADAVLERQPPADEIVLNSVEDYFDAIPEEFLYPGISIEQRKNILNKYYGTRTEDPGLTENISVAVSDIKNGYIKTEGKGEDVPSGYEVVLFKKPDGTFIVGINKIECGTIGCFYELKFIEYANKKWTDVTKSVLPDMTPFTFAKKSAPEKYKALIKSSIGVQYTLPQKGTDIDAMFVDHFDPDTESSEIGKTFDELEYTLFTLSWKDGKFFISRKDKNDGD